MLNFVLCDDNYIILDRLGKMLDSLFIKYNVEACILYKTTTPEDLLDYVNNNDVNVLILDIDLKSSMSGLDIAEKVRKKDKNIYIIFSTAHLEYGLVAYRYKTFDYIPKPITTQRLEDTFLRLLDDMNGNVNEYIQLDNSKILCLSSFIHLACFNSSGNFNLISFIISSISSLSTKHLLVNGTFLLFSNKSSNSSNNVNISIIYAPFPLRI